MREIDEIRGDDPVGLSTSFSIAVEPQRDRLRVAPCGELDLANIGQFRNELNQLVGAGFSRIIIDLRCVQFIDSTGLHALLAAHSAAERDHWELTIVPGPPAVQRLFELTCTVDLLPFAAESG